MEEQESFDKSLEMIMQSLPHFTIEYAPLQKEELEQMLKGPNPIRSHYSVGEEYIPRQGFTIGISYDVPELRFLERGEKSISYIGPSGNILSGLLVAEYDEDGRLTIEGYSHPNSELKRFSATGNVERATVIRLPTLFDNIPQLSEIVPVFLYDNNDKDPKHVSLSMIASGKINPLLYRPSSILNTGSEHSIKPYILSLSGTDGKPVYDGRFGMHIKD